MVPLIAIVGESGSGKTTLAKMLAASDPKYHRVLQDTTRPKRPIEKNGEDYNFIPDSTFELGLKYGYYLEYAKYRDWWYGTTKTALENENAIVVLTPAGLRELKREREDVISIYLSVDRRSRLIKMLYRGDDIEEACRRSVSDAGQFDRVEKEVDYVIDNTKYYKNEIEVLREAQRFLSTIYPLRGNNGQS